MNWHLPEKRKQLLRVYSNALSSSEWTPHRRRYLLFLILRPAIGWAKKYLIEAGLEPDEAESEMFLLASRLLSSYDAEQSCFLYHIEKKLPWGVSEILRKLKKQQREDPSGLFLDDEAYEMEGEIYLTIPNFLFEERWLAKNLSQYEKNLILRVLTKDQPSCKALANSCQVSRWTMSRDLFILAGKLKGWLL